MNKVLAKLFYDSVQLAKGWDYKPYLADLERSQWQPIEKRNELQRLKLVKLLRHCADHVPFYRDAFLDIGVKAKDIRDESVLESLPIVTKKTLRENYIRFFSDDQKRPFDVWKTSGSTGEPFAFRLDKNSIAANTYAALARGRRWWGIDYGIREAMVWSCVRDVSDTLLGRMQVLKRQWSWSLKNIRLIDTYSLDHTNVETIYHDLLKFRPECMRSISSGLFRFCVLLDDLGLDGLALGVRYAIYTGEAFPEAQKVLVERVLGCKTICEYGCSEVGIIAFECPKGGLHLNHENLFFEFLKNSDHPTAGQEAEVVVTNLNDYVVPLIRYAVGDVVVPSNETCTCGRTLPLISSVGGRSHAFIKIPGGGVLHGLYFTHLFDGLPSVTQFRVIQEKINELRIELFASEPISSVDKSFVVSSLVKEMGVDCRVVVQQVDDMPLSHSGKFQWIVSKL